MSEAVAQRMVPRGALLGAAALIGFSLVAAALGRITGVGTVRADYATTVQSASFRFEDRNDGGIAVIPKQDTVAATAATLSQFCDAHPRSTLHFLTEKELLEHKSIVAIVKISSTSSTSCQKIKGIF